ncbi:MAG TPA: hypothetical protein VIL71_10480 [Spirillospora sp.]
MTDISEESTVREHARFLVALGNDEFSRVVRDCVDVAEGESEEAIRQIVTEELEAHLAEQDTWPDELDTDRLHRAFRELDMAGIVARLDHACCQRCGLSEIYEQFPPDEVRRGYVFAHRQDMQDAVRFGGLTLAYGVLSKGPQPPDAQAEIGREVAEALRRHGLEVDWNGDPRQRITVPLTWRRRRFGRLAEYPGAEPAPSDRPLLVSYTDKKRRVEQWKWIPASVPHARDVLLTTTPYDGSFMGFSHTSGAGFSAYWKPGPVLVAEVIGDLDGARPVSISEAERLVSVLAREGRVALDDPAGE